MKPDPEYLEIIPCLPPKDYTTRAEKIRHGLRAIIFIGLIVFVGFVLFALGGGTP